MDLISDTESLAAFCSRIANSSYLTVDTEFLREKTYWPQLCLIQMAGDDDAAVIDALAPSIDLQPVFDLMDDSTLLKVFHAGRQDLEIFYHLNGRLPAPIFDTQVAAMVCGFGDSVGYETLVSKLAKQDIDKSSRFTDWSHRPLTARQLDYALADVTHLRVIYDKLNNKLSSNGRHQWLEEEIGTLTSNGTYEMDPAKSWKRVKSRNPKPRFLAILREVAGWREIEAKRRDVPRNRIVRDEALIEIAHHSPKSVSELARVRGLGKNLAEGRGGAEILAAVERGKALPDAECPRVERKEPLPRGIGPITDLLKVFLKMRCEELDVAPKLVASSSDIDKLAAFGPDADVPALKGWRHQIFGEDAIALRDGKFAVIVRNRALALIEPETSNESSS